MPLLNGKPLVLHSVTKSLEPNKEVFYCEETDEVFEDFDAYNNRLLSCKLPIWTCAITGKQNLTYKEALLSEEKTLGSLNQFSTEVTTCILYLANITEKKSTGEVFRDIYSFICDKFLKNELIEVNFGNGQWVWGRVVEIILPTPDEVVAYGKEKGLLHPLPHRPYSAKLYKYEVEEVASNEEQRSAEEWKNGMEIIRTEVLTLPQIRRPKGAITKVKLRDFLKLVTIENGSKFGGLKNGVADKFRIASVKFSDIFIGEAPIFKATNSNKLQQGTLDKFLIKTKEKPNNPGKEIVSQAQANKAKNAQLEKQKLKEQERVKKLERIREQKEAVKREKERLAKFASEWQKTREDLELDDLREMPEPCAVECRIPNECFGEAMMILEFFASFEKILKTKEYFPYGLTFDLLQRALIDVEIAGPYCDLLLFFLSRIFQLQKEELEEVRGWRTNYDIKISEIDCPNIEQSLKLANKISKWSPTYLGLNITEIGLNSIVVTDVLRLHLLVSGCKQERAGSAKNRWTHRGGFSDSDDPAVMFRINEPHIFKFLANHCAVELPVEDKLKVLHCLMGQILTFGRIRLELEKTRDRENQIKLDQLNDLKREKEILKELKDIKEKSEKSEKKREQLNEQLATIKTRSSETFSVLFKESMGFQMQPIGLDRGYRKFWVFSKVPGLFIEDSEQWPGECLEKPTPNPRSSICLNEDEDTMTYIRKLYESCRQSSGSDKENNCDNKEIESLNVDLSVNKVAANETEEVITRLRCTANKETCSVHNPGLPRTKWFFFYKENDIEELLKALNKRGVREKELRRNLTALKSLILKDLSKCPVHFLNRFLPGDNDCPPTSRAHNVYRSANAKYPQDMPVSKIVESCVRELLVQMEEDIHVGNLGRLKVKNREKWIKGLLEDNYDQQDSKLSWCTSIRTRGSPESSKNDEEDSDDDGDDDNDNEHNSPHEVIPQVISNLSRALLQIGRSVDRKFLLPTDTKNRAPLEPLENWEISLMQSTSLCMVYLHAIVLKSTIDWSKSLAKMRCRVCMSSRNRGEKIRCDDCGKGSHIFCLKPKLGRVPQTSWFCSKCVKAKNGKRSSHEMVESDVADKNGNRSFKRLKQ